MNDRDPARDARAQAQWEASVALAERDLAHIHRLLDSEPFEQYFRRRLRERRDGYAKSLESDLSDQITRDTRVRIREIDEILRIPEQERTLHNSTIHRARK